MSIKISSRYRVLIFALLMSFNTAFLVSGVIAFTRSPSMDAFLETWLSSFLLAWPLVFLSILWIAPQVNKVVNFLVKDTP